MFVEDKTEVHQLTLCALQSLCVDLQCLLELLDLLLLLVYLFSQVLQQIQVTTDNYR